MKMRFTVQGKKGDKSTDPEYTFYAGPNFDDAVEELNNARRSVKAAEETKGSYGWVAMWAYDRDNDSQLTLVWEEYS